MRRVPVRFAPRCGTVSDMKVMLKPFELMQAVQVAEMRRVQNLKLGRQPTCGMTKQGPERDSRSGERRDRGRDPHRGVTACAALARGAGRRIVAPRGLAAPERDGLVGRAGIVY